MATAAQQAAGLARRRERFETRIVWLGQQVQAGLTMTMRARVRLCGQLVRDKTVINLSTPVRKIRGRSRGGRFTAARVDPRSRSNRGEFPRADTTRLMKDIYYESTGSDGLTAIVGTTLDYGLLLETVMGRPFLRRTLDELQPQLRTILTSGRGGGGNLSFPNT